MAHAGRIVALGLTLVVGVLGGVVIERTTAEPDADNAAAGSAVVHTVTQAGPVTADPVTVTATIPADAVTVTATVQADPVTVTATVAPRPNSDPTGPKANGNYLVGAELTPGTWKCAEAGSFTTWITRDQTNGVVDIGTGTLAVVSDGAYIADLNDCTGTWSLVG